MIAFNDAPQNVKDKYIRLAASFGGNDSSDLDILTVIASQLYMVQEKHGLSKYKKANFPEKFICKQREWEKEKGTEDMTLAIINYAKDLQNNLSTGKNLIVIGKTPGTGKTRSVCYVLKAAIDCGLSCFFVPDNELADCLSDEDFDNAEYRRTECNRLAHIDFFVIDDIGAGKWSDKGVNRLYTILNERYNNNRPTAATGNYKDFTEMQTACGERLFSRLSENAVMAINTSTIDYRIKDNL